MRTDRFGAFLLRAWAAPALALLAGSCSPALREHTLSGHTMGTTYSIRIADAPLSRRAVRQLQTEIDAALDEINRQMSTYLADSVISRFNRDTTLTPLAVSADFLKVAQMSLDLAAATGGAFDPTVGALVNLWGFGPEGRMSRKPSPDQIETARRQVGYRHLSITPDGRIAKDIAGLQLDLGAAAQGFAVDKAAGILRARALTNFLVEIGGETVAEGVNAEGQTWRVGVQRPNFDAVPGQALQGVIHLTGGRALSTSGDYQNYFRDEDGQVCAHIIDPRTAAPVRHAVASVTVLAGDCLTADGFATALYVLGPDEGLSLLASRFPGVEALFVLRTGEDAFQEITSPGFADAAGYEPWKMQ